MVLPEGFRREHHENLGSTNARALEAARTGASGNLWVTAGEQTAGRGRRGRPWTTVTGNLAASLLLLDPAPADVAPTLSFVAAVALHQAAATLIGPAAAPRLALKWPNDLLLDGMKVAGILIEGEALPHNFAVAIGIGVNCVAHPRLEEPLAAADFAARGLPLHAEELMERLAAEMAVRLHEWDRGRGFADTRRAWLARATGLGERIRVNLSDASLEGRFETIDDAGRLVLLVNDGTRRLVSAGDVFPAMAV
jgi:BirA family biotin operon repressor/biotin-[acetyl-CoA-carboxylase] ligase